MQTENHQRVTNGQGSTTEAHSERPCPPIEEVADDLLLRHHIGNTISTVHIDTIDDELSLLLVQEFRLIREVDDDQETSDTEGDGNDSEQEEDPSPSVKLASGFDLGESVTDNLGKAGDRHREQVE